MLHKHRAGAWLPKDKTQIKAWIQRLKARVYQENRELIEPIQDLRTLVKSNIALSCMADGMFKEAALRESQTPLDTPEIKDFDEFLILLNGIMSQAPEYYAGCKDADGPDQPCGLIGFPINALLDWPMATSFGYDFFANALVNQQFKKILNYWHDFLLKPDSRYVLIQNDLNATPKVYAWLSDIAKAEVTNVACSAVTNDPSLCTNSSFEDIFICNPSDEYYGYGSWDAFFTRRFRTGQRPVAQGDDVIASACESGPLQIATNVQKNAQFWLKGQPYSLENMMNFDPLAKQFIGGTVYQAFLSALSYHRWNAPVDGRVVKQFVVNGSYYLENAYQGFSNPDGGDPSAPNDSQPFLSAVATRGVIFIQADNPKIGLMCFIAIGMAEVSSCDITVEEGQHIAKGQELGMFHFGGSTHCLIFGPDVKLEFTQRILQEIEDNNKGLATNNIPVCSQIARVL